MEIDYFQDLPVFLKARTQGSTCRKYNNQPLLEEEVCISNSANPRVLFVGDSHAMALYSSLLKGYQNLDAMLIAGHSCPTYVHVRVKHHTQRTWGNMCEEIALNAVEAVKTIKSIQNVAIVNDYTYSKPDVSEECFEGDSRITSEEAFLEGNKAFIAAISKLGRKVVWVVDTPSLRGPPETCIQRSRYFPMVRNCGLTRGEYGEQRGNYLRLVSYLKDSVNALQVFDATSIFCDEAFCREKLDGKFLYADDHHISVFASEKILETFGSYLNKN